MRDAITVNGPPRGPLERIPGPQEVVPKLLAIELVDAAVGVALARHLVAAARHLPDQLGHLVGDPPQHEEGRSGVELIKQIEGFAGVVLDPPLEAVPALILDHALQRRDVEVVLEDDRQQVPARARPARFVNSRRRNSACALSGHGRSPPVQS